MKPHALKAIAAAAALAVPAFAIAGGPGSGERFERLDRNGDGFVTRDEAKDAEELNTRFTELDRNNDNKLSLPEYAVLEHEARAAAEKAAAEKAAAGGSGKTRNARKGD